MIVHYKNSFKAPEMTSQIKALAAKPDNPSSTPRVHMVGEMQHLKIVL